MKTARELVDQLNTKEFFSPYQIEDIIDTNGVVEVTKVDIVTGKQIGRAHV